MAQLHKYAKQTCLYQVLHAEGKDHILQSQMCCLRVGLHFIKLIKNSMTCIQLHESNPRAFCFTPIQNIQTSDYVNGQKATKTPHSTQSSSMRLIWSCFLLFCRFRLFVIELSTRTCDWPHASQRIANCKTKHWLRDASGSVWKHVLLSFNLCLND